FFGDSGKGSVVARFNELLTKKHGSLLSLRWNGGANAGHETTIDGKKIITHQLPMGVVTAGATALVTRGMVLHPEDLVFEIQQIESSFGGKLPGNLVIDERTPLSLDTHRAYEIVLNKLSIGGRGSTGRGIAPGYASVYERIPVTVKDLLRRDWKDTLRKHFKLYKWKIGKNGQSSAANILVSKLGQQGVEKHPLGTEKDFLNRLAWFRETLRPHVSARVFDLLQETWNDYAIPVTLEGAQGAGIDPYHGVYPDVTASRPMSRNINDATYNVILPEEIALRTAVMKTTYVSSVGTRVIPDVMTEKDKERLQVGFDEFGRSTGRPRGILAVSIPIAQYLRRAAGYQYLVATHLDAAEEGRTIQVVTHYTDKVTGEEVSYFPYQDAVDHLEPHAVEFEGWDGKAVKAVKKPEDLPLNTRLYLAFLSRTIAPVAIATTGPDVGDSISWLPDGSL
ncbi:MAG: adenylosuccinate synthetase, partial [Candidatus Blackburnbacteria bacterium]|nr:adenylosuccinate synthetase [Candidatus Blackburnbacteria bacterium]